MSSPSAAVTPAVTGDPAVGTAGPALDTRGLLAGAGAYGIWGIFPLYFHRLRGVGALEVASYRLLATALVVWLVLVVRRDLSWTGALRNRRTIVRTILSGAMITSNWLIYVWAVQNDHVVDAAIGYYTNPLIVVAIGVFVLREHLRTLQKAALACGATAVAVLTFAYGKVPWIALGLALTFAAYGFLKKTVPLASLHSLATETTLMAPLGVVVLSVIGGRTGLDATRAPTATLVALAFIGIVTAVPLVLFGIGARRLPLAQIGLLQYMTPTLALLTAVFVFHENVAAERWVGMAIVWVALVLLAVDAARATRTSR